MFYKHERKKNRLYGFDYRNDGFYFITICSKARLNYFGRMHNKTMCVNRLSTILYFQWKWLTHRYPYIRSHAFMVMPNHVHAVVEINRGFVGNSTVGTDCRVGTGRDLSLHCKNNIKIKSLSELIGVFKTTSSKLIHRSGFPEFLWQRSFHDHIIQDENSFHKICDYTRHNPKLWDRDRNNILDLNR